MYIDKDFRDKFLKQLKTEFTKSNSIETLL